MPGPETSACYGAQPKKKKMKYRVGTQSKRLILVCFLETVPDVNFSNKL